LRFISCTFSINKNNLRKRKDRPKPKYDIPLDDIVKSIRSYNIERFQKLGNEYILLDAITGKDNTFISPEAFMSAVQGSALKKQKGAGQASPYEQNILSILDLLGIKDIIDNMDNRKILVLGEAGIGKSTSLQYLSYQHSSTDNSEVPIYVDLKVHDIYSAIWEYTGKLSLGLNKSLKNEKIFCISMLSRILDAGNFIFLLDGYNEIGSRRPQVKEDLDRLVSSNHELNNRFVITSRKHDYPSHLNDFNTCEITLLSDAQRINLMKKLGVTSILHIEAEIEHNRIDSLSRIPLFLKYTCKHFNTEYSFDELPSSRGKLLNLIIEDHLYEHESKLDRSVDNVIGKKELLTDVLPRVAYSSLKENNGNYFDLGQFSDVINSEELSHYKKAHGRRYTAARILDAIKRYNLVISHGNNYSFWHQLFQDYFASLQIKVIIESVSNSAEYKALIEELYIDQNEEAILILCGLLDNNDAIKLIKQLSEYRTGFALKCMREIDNISGLDSVIEDYFVDRKILFGKEHYHNYRTIIDRILNKYLPDDIKGLFNLAIMLEESLLYQSKTPFNYVLDYIHNEFVY
jgi:hypothetical protein